jgi:hypothetical protein
VESIKAFYKTQISGVGVRGNDVGRESMEDN